MKPIAPNTDLYHTKQSLPVLIIGGGPAGYTAAIYAARAGLQPVLYEGRQPGGQLTTTVEVENYPGYPTGVLGTKMMGDFKAQAARFGADLRKGLITAVDFTTYPYLVTTETQVHLAAKTLIIATGASVKQLGLESEKQLYGKGVSSCAVCDGFFFKGQDVAVVGGGDTAAEESLYLSKLCKKVYMLVRRGEMRASKIMQDRISKVQNITVLWHREVVEIGGVHSVTYLTLRNKQTDAKETLEVQGCFIAIGHQPNTNLFIPHLAHDAMGYIITTPGSTSTSLPGVFAAGDVQDSRYRQAITSAASGCMAALDADRFLAEKQG